MRRLFLFPSAKEIGPLAPDPVPLFVMGLVGESLDDSDTFQCILLQLGVLLCGADAGVPDEVRSHSVLPCPCPRLFVCDDASAAGAWSGDLSASRAETG